jgi:hypothetical protein
VDDRALARACNPPAPSDLLRLFGARLRERRESLLLSQSQVGELAGIDRTAVARYERGADDLRLSAILRLSGALAVPFGDLLGGLSWYPGEWVLVGGGYYLATPGGQITLMSSSGNNRAAGRG